MVEISISLTQTKAPGQPSDLENKSSRTSPPLAQDGVEELLDHVPGVGNVGEAVPSHCAELQQAEQDRQPLLTPPKRREQREEEEEEHRGRGHPPRRREHVLYLKEGQD